MEALRDKLKWLMGIRVAVVTLTLGVSIYLQIGKNAQSIPAYYSLIVATYLLTILYSLLINRIRRLVPFAYFQIGVDILFESALVTITGGVESPFSLLYIISITAASAMLSRQGGLAAASMAGICYGAIVDVQYYRSIYEVLPSLSVLRKTDLPVPEVFYNLAINILGFIMVGYLSGTLAEKLKSTGERLAEKARDLTQLREFHRCILESIDSGVFTTDLEGRILSFNRKAEQLLGYAEAEVRGRSWAAVFAWPDYARDQLLAATLPRRMEETGRRKDGNQLIVGMSLAPLHVHGAQTGMVGVFQDITPLRKMEEVVRRKQWLARIGEMSAGMAHEIRNPLAALSGSMQVLRKDLRTSNANRLLLDLALRETERLNEIVSDFLQYARPRPLNLKQCDVNELVDNTLRMLEQTPEYGKTIRFVRRLMPENVTTMLDPDQIRQVCWNLGLNACQAMPAGGTLMVSTQRVRGPVSGEEGEAVEIVFEDTGEGILREHLDKVFYPFFTTKERGVGLGLSMVHRIMDEHRGSVHVDSVPAEGTCVRLMLPVVGEMAQEAR
ncbi:MAG TPA: ATP-binding protein [Nitrospirales bacterium]|nr:ATP-binding protein [Nitrospirales bacterium]